jgi:hypothetical protein
LGRRRRTGEGWENVSQTPKPGKDVDSDPVIWTACSCVPPSFSRPPYLVGAAAGDEHRLPRALLKRPRLDARVGLEGLRIAIGRTAKRSEVSELVDQRTTLQH